MITREGRSLLPLSARAIVPGASYVWAGDRVRAVRRPRYIPGGWSVLVRNEKTEYNAGMEYEVDVNSLLLPEDWDAGYRYDSYSGLVLDAETYEERQLEREAIMADNQLERMGGHPGDD